MGISGKRTYISKEDLIVFGNDFEIESAQQIVDEVYESIAHFTEFAKSNDIPNEWIERINTVLKNII